MIEPNLFNHASEIGVDRYYNMTMKNANGSKYFILPDGTNI